MMGVFQQSGISVLGSMINKGLTALIEKKLVGAGAVEHIELDKQQRNIQVTLLLEGETESVRICLEGYRLETKDGRTRIAFERIITSRRWLSMLLHEYGQGMSFPVPSKYASMVSLILP
ncbi:MULTISPECIES: hypothetical protein [unclassified Oceanobacter]|uniref:hypothetical protein n=1 Tax=unclassified Oceanobacter TaxID=2620260 RepID=UPI002736DDD5|nr:MULTISPECIES: hypothetical protein [unclassified Oceanobacter]MDP2506244.1 hypothetical protein [Oceanobacter sp. 3_MG-2023]MDP2546494.1 hypothetical protein [Oceanobacter sp. 4_MG-2023]